MDGLIVIVVLSVVAVIGIEIHYRRSRAKIDAKYAARQAEIRVQFENAQQNIARAEEKLADVRRRLDEAVAKKEADDQRLADALTEEQKLALALHQAAKKRSTERDGES